MDLKREWPLWVVITTFIVGLLVGLVVLGWWLFPVEYTGTTPDGLFPEWRSIYIRNAAELFSFDNNQDKLRASLSGWSGDQYACEMAAESTDPADQQRLIAAATVVNGVGCTGAAAIPGESIVAEPESSSTTLENLLPLLLLAALLLGLGGAIWYVYSRRKTLMEEPVTSQPEQQPPPEAVAAAAVAIADAADEQQATETEQYRASHEEAIAVPIARFRTNYSRGHDTYDDSFSIENTNGDFLGECGVGISEVIGAGTPKNVTAFEVWLFDKNDIRTITKVIMSDHAFFDEALKAKLAPKGEPVLARENETIVLETASLIINAEITEMIYGAENELPDRSYFDLFTIELSAWSKESETSEQQAASADDVLSY